MIGALSNAGNAIFNRPFFVSFYLTLGWGVFVAQSGLAVGDTFLYLGIFMLSAAFQQFLFGTKYFEKVRGLESLGVQVNDFYIAGRTIDLGKKSALENNILSEILSGLAQLKIKISALLILILCLYLMKTHRVHFKLVIPFHFLTAVTLVLAMVLNHFLIPLAINIAAVIFSYTLETPAPTWQIFPYCLLLVATFVFYQRLEIECLTSRSAFQGSAYKAYYRAIKTILSYWGIVAGLLIGVDQSFEGSADLPSEIEDEKVYELKAKAELYRKLPAPVFTGRPETRAETGAVPVAVATATPLDSSKIVDPGRDFLEGGRTKDSKMSEGVPQVRNISQVVFILTLLIVFVILGFLYFKYLKRRNIGKISKNLRTWIRSEIRRIMGLSRSGGAEVIEKYGLFLNIFYAANSPRPEHYSPSDFCLEMITTHPKIRSEIQSITEVFSDVYYGGISPSESTISKYRSSLKKILNYFSL